MKALRFLNLAKLMRRNSSPGLVVRAMTLLLVALLASGCMESQGRGGKPLIEDFSIKTETEETGCNDFISSDFNQCVPECATSERLASADEVTEIIASIKSTQGLSTEDEQTLKENVAQAKGVCIEDIKRPTGAVFVKSDYCACQNSTPLILNNCVAFCNGKSTNNEETLFVNVNLGPAIELNESLGSLKNWCSKEIDDGKVKPSCKLELRDSSGTRFIEVKEADIGTKSFKADIKTLPKDITFVARLVENTSGAASNEFQVRKFTFVGNQPPPTGPLKLMSSAQYTCVRRAGSGSPDGIDFNNMIRFHFYFAANKLPPSLPPTGDGIVFCHDINTYGLNDSPLFPRMELIPQHFSVWDESDPRFVDSDANQKEDVNDEMQRRLLQEYGITKTIKIFGKLSWPNVIPTGSGGGSAVAPSIGYFMQPWVNSLTGRGFCPTQEHYNGSDPTFKVMKEIIGVDTEGLYISEREPLTVVDGNGNQIQAPSDFLLIRENVLKKIWFYFENGRHYIPDDISAGQKTIMFYWPADVQNPYIRKSTQYIYTVKSIQDLNTGGAGTNTGISTSIRPPDKRYGCIPSLGPAN